MRNKETFIICLGLIFVSSYVVGFVLTDSSKLSEVVTTVTAIIGAIAIWYQLKKDLSVVLEENRIDRRFTDFEKYICYGV